jgi:ribonuclease HI
MVTEVFTDGACLGNPGPGGWAFVVDGGRWSSGAEPDTTNQRMELLAASTAVQALDGPLRVVSDSAYVVNCFKQGWWKGWLAKGWRNSQRQPVANRDLWEPFIELVNARGDVEFVWVKGHSGHRLNDAADRLATAAASEQRGRSGEPGGPTRRVDPTEGHVVAVLGHRPPELGGYQENPVSLGVRRRLIEILRAKKELHPDLVVVTGLGLGTEMIGAEAAAAAAVPHVAVLAFEGVEAKWPEATRRRFVELLQDSAAVVVVGDEAPRSPAEFGKAMGRRDDWITRHASEAILVRSPDDRTLGDLHRKLERALGEELWVLEP